MVRMWWFFRTCVYTLAYLLVFYLWAWGQGTTVLMRIDKAYLGWTWLPQPGSAQVTFSIICDSPAGLQSIRVEVVDPLTRTVPISQIATRPGDYTCRVYAKNAAGVSPASPAEAFTIGTILDVSKHNILQTK